MTTMMSLKALYIFIEWELLMIILNSHFTNSPTRDKFTISNHYNLTGNLCEKHVTQLGIEPRTFGLLCHFSTPEMSDHTNCPWYNLYLLYPLAI